MTIGFTDAVGVTHWTTAAPNTRGKTRPCTVVQRLLLFAKHALSVNRRPFLGSSRHAHAMGRQCASHPTPQSCLFPERRTTGRNARGLQGALHWLFRGRNTTPERKHGPSIVLCKRLHCIRPSQQQRYPANKRRGKNYNGQHQDPCHQPRLQQMAKEHSFIQQIHAGNRRCDRAGQARLNHTEHEVSVASRNSQHR